MSRREFWIRKSPEERRQAVKKIEKERRRQRLGGGGNSSFNQMIQQGGDGLRNLSRGVYHSARGMVEMGVGFAQELDACALGLGVLAIMTVGLAASPIFAVISRGENIVDVNKKVAYLAQNPNYARLVGYPLLAIGGVYVIKQVRDM